MCERVAAAGRLTQGFIECASARRPIVRLVAIGERSVAGPDRIVGDVVITDSEQAQELACVRIIEGSLVVDDGVAEDIVLSALVEVTADVTLVYERGAGYAAELEAVHLPRLRTIGGAVSLYAPITTGEASAVRVDFGMPALTLLDGDLWIGIDSFNCGFAGLRSLAYLPGSVSVQGCTSDGNGRSLLGGLLRVDGDLRLSLNGNAQVGFFPSVEVVAGNVMVDRANLTSADNFARPHWVQGRLQLSNVSSLGFLDDPPFRSLARVGSLEWLDTERIDLGVAVPAVRLGGLRVAGNDWLTDLPGWTVDFELKPAASITITGNPNLRDCDAADWVASLPGHTGPVSIFGNQPCP